ncbi:histidine phosphatase family protein [soil metagenome]
MKTLLLIRHAKSDWNDFDLADIDRPLNQRGKEDAPEMAERIRNRISKIDAFISSPAKRARKTAKFFVHAYNKRKDDIQIEQSLYEAPVTAYEKMLARINEQYSTAAIFAHNPGITDFVNTLTEEIVYNMPTCAVFAVRAYTDKWEDFKNAKKEFLFFETPKNQS